MNSEQQDYRAGVRAGMPVWFGIGAWGLVVGVAMVKTGLSVWQAAAMSLFVYAGSAQLAALPLMAAHVHIGVIFATALVVNLRFVIFSALMAPHFTDLPWYKRIWFGFITGDVAVAIFAQRYPDHAPDKGKLPFLKGILYPNWLAWQLGSLAGMVLGSQIPDRWGVGFAGTLAILTITLPMVANRAALIGCIVAAIVGLIGIGWPYKLGLLLAVVVGMSVSLFVASWQARAKGDVA